MNGKNEKHKDQEIIQKKMLPYGQGPHLMQLLKAL